MLFRLIKKITKNYGVFFALFLGIILSLVTINSTTMYGNTLKDSLFQRTLKDFEKNYNQTAGTVLIQKEKTFVKVGLSDTFGEKNKKELGVFNREVIDGRSVAELHNSIFLYEENDMRVGELFCNDYKLKSMRDLHNHVNIVQGRIYQKSFRYEDKNIIEVIVDRNTMINLKLEMDKLYLMEVLNIIDVPSIRKRINKKTESKLKLTYFKIVGVYEEKKNDVFWRKGLLKKDKNEFMIHENAMELLCIQENKKVDISREYFIDLDNFKYQDLKEFVKEIDGVKKRFVSDEMIYKSNLNNIAVINDRDFKLVSNMLWIIQIPVIAILFLYVLMITGIIVDRDKDEMALLRSRGATRWKILFNYLFDGFVILIGGLLVTPILSIIAVKVMSKTSGFMEFQGISSQNIYFSIDNIYCSIATGGIFLCALLIPVLKATKEGIIDRKASKVRIKFSTWKKSFIDFILIGVGFYGLSLFMKSKGNLKGIEANINTIALDPLIFLAATILAFGFSLLFLRIYPYLIKGVLKICKKIMPAHIFVLFSNLSRKPGKREYTMLFIMILISSSIFNLKIARTINCNVIDNIRYRSGAEVKMEGIWVSDVTMTSNNGDSEFDVFSNTDKIEPDFDQYKNLESLESVTKVLEIENIALNKGALNIDRVKVIAVQPNSFGKTAYMRRDLTPEHWYNYLNILAAEPSVVFLSSSIEQHQGNKMKLGDLITLNIKGFNEKFFFGGYIDYWPGYIDRNKPLVVGNFDYFYSRIARSPYAIWGKLKKDKSEDELIKEMKDKSILLSKFDSISDLTKENIFLKAVNAAITISFILSMIVTLLGFLIYWCICIRERELQFGILRSLGIKIKKLYTMILMEQLIVTGAALSAGIGIGQFISSNFLKIATEIVFGNTLVLPIVHYISSKDYLLIIAMIVISIILVLIFILKYISDLKLSQAIKIGED